MPADEVLEEFRDLGSGRRFAGVPANHHRHAALHVIDVDGEKAACIVVGVERRQLLVALFRLQVSPLSNVMVPGGAGKLQQRM